MWFDQDDRVREHQEQLRREAASWRLARVAARRPTRWSSALRCVLLVALRHPRRLWPRQVDDGCRVIDVTDGVLDLDISGSSYGPSMVERQHPDPALAHPISARQRGEVRS